VTECPEPLVSLIMPVWQPRPSWLHDAVASALNQRDCAVEVIAVDDGNAAPVADLLRGIGDARLRVVRIAHGGPNAARNAGIAAARGDWIRFVDADDVLVIDSTWHLASITKGDAVIAYGATAVTDEHLRPRYVVASALQGNVVLPCLLGRFHTRLPALLFPRSVVERAGPWDPAFRVSGDWDFVLRAVEHAPVVGDGRLALYYRRHGDSVTGGADIAMGERARERVIAKYFDRHPHQRGTAIERRALAAQWLDRGLQYWRAGRYGPSLDRLTRALVRDPIVAAPAVTRFALQRMQHLIGTTHTV
jgi:glycosyltransferase involved in cell wall biosynthesis